LDAVLILADGVWEDDAQARDLASLADLVIAADGGYAQALRAGARVDLVIGDLDSLRGEALLALEGAQVEIRQFPAEKDKSDLELALDHALAEHPRTVTILGSLGRRLDHAVVNIHLLGRGLRAGVDVRLIDGRQSVVLVRGRHEIAGAAIGDLVSLVPLSAAVRVFTTGLRYRLCGECLARASSRGISNEVTAVPALVRVLRGDLLVIHRALREAE
jgi:thiamine pyrophosphokinase